MVLKKILLLFSRKQKNKFFIVIFLGIIFSVLELFSIAIFLPLINLIQSGNIDFILDNNFFNKVFTEYLHISEYKQVTIFVSVFIIIVYLIKLIYHRFFNRFRLKFVNNFTENLINTFSQNFKHNLTLIINTLALVRLFINFTESNQIRNILDSLF